MNDCWKCEKLKTELYCLEKIRVDFLKLKHVLFAQDETIRRSESQVLKDNALRSENEALRKELSLLKSERLNLQVQSEKQNKLILDLEKQVVQHKDDNSSAEKELLALQAKLEKLQQKIDKSSTKRPTKATRGKKVNVQDEENAELLNLIESELAAVESPVNRTSELETGIAIPGTGGDDTEAFLPSCSDLDTSEDEAGNEKITVASASSPFANNCPTFEGPGATETQLADDIEKPPESVQEDGVNATSRIQIGDVATTVLSGAPQTEVDILSDITEALHQDTTSQKTKIQLNPVKNLNVHLAQFSPTKTQNASEEQPGTPQKKHQKISPIEKKAKIVLDEDAGKETFVQTKQRRAHAPKVSSATVENEKSKKLVPEKPEPVSEGNEFHILDNTKKNDAVVNGGRKLGPSSFRLKSKSDSSESESDVSEVISGMKRKKRSTRNISRRVIEDSDEEDSDSPHSENETCSDSVENRNPDLDEKRSGLTADRVEKTDLHFQSTVTGFSKSDSSKTIGTPGNPVVLLSRLRDDNCEDPGETTVKTIEVLNSSETAKVTASVKPVAEVEKVLISDVTDPVVESNGAAEKETICDVINLLVENNEGENQEKVFDENAALANISCELNLSFNESLKDISIHESDIDVSPTKLARKFFNESFDKDLINSESDDDRGNELGVSYQRKDSVKIVEKLFKEMFQENAGKLWFETSFDLLDVEKIDFELPETLNYFKPKNLENSAESAFVYDNVESLQDRNDDVSKEKQVCEQDHQTDYFQKQMKNIDPKTTLESRDVSKIPEPGEKSSDLLSSTLIKEMSCENDGTQCPGVVVVDSLEIIEGEKVSNENEKTTLESENLDTEREANFETIRANRVLANLEQNSKIESCGVLSLCDIVNEQNVISIAAGKFGENERTLHVEEYESIIPVLTEGQSIVTAHSKPNTNQRLLVSASKPNTQQTTGCAPLEQMTEQANPASVELRGERKHGSHSCVISQTMIGKQTASILVNECPINEKQKLGFKNFQAVSDQIISGGVTIGTIIHSNTAVSTDVVLMSSPTNGSEAKTTKNQKFEQLSSDIVAGSIDDIQCVFENAESKASNVDSMIRNSLCGDKRTGDLEMRGCKTPERAARMCSLKKVGNSSETEGAAVRRSPRIQKKTIQYVMDGFSVKLSDDLPESPKKDVELENLATKNVKWPRNRRLKKKPPAVSANSDTTLVQKRPKVQNDVTIMTKTARKARKIVTKTARTQPMRSRKAPAKVKNRECAVILDSETSSHVEEIISCESESIVEVFCSDVKAGDKVENLTVSDSLQTSAKPDSGDIITDDGSVGQEGSTNDLNQVTTSHNICSTENVFVAEETVLLRNSADRKESVTNSFLHDDKVFSFKTCNIGGSSDVTLCDEAQTIQTEIKSVFDTRKVHSNSECLDTIQNNSGDKNLAAGNLQTVAIESSSQVEDNAENLQTEVSPTRTGVFWVEESGGSDLDSDEGGLCIDLGEEEQTSNVETIAHENSVLIPGVDENAEKSRSDLKSQLKEVRENLTPQIDVAIGQKDEIGEQLVQEAEKAQNEQFEVPGLLFCGSVEQQISEVASSENMQPDVPQLVFCGNVTRPNEQPQIEYDSIPNFQNVTVSFSSGTVKSPLSLLSGDVNDETIADFGVEEVICGEVVSDEITKFLNDTSTKISKDKLTEQRVVSANNTYGAKRFQDSTRGDDPDPDPDFHPTLSSGSAKSYFSTRSNATEFQSQFSDNNCKVVIKKSFEPQKKSHPSLRKISRKVYLNSVNQVRSLMKAKGFQNVREGEELILEDDDELDIKMEATDGDDDEDFVDKKRRAPVNWKSNFTTRSGTKRECEDEGPCAKQPKRAADEKTTKKVKTANWNMEMKEETHDCKGKQENTQSQKRRYPIPFPSESTSSYEAMLYVKKVVTDLKPEDSGGSERKKFYVEELTKVFQDGKLTVGLFLAGIFYHFLQRTAKENVLISKIGVSAELVVDLQRSVGIDLKDVWKEAWTLSPSFISSEGKSKPKCALMFAVSLFSKLIASLDCSDQLGNEEESSMLKEKYLSAVRIFVYDVIVCVPCGWSEVVGLAFREIHHLYRRYSEEHGDQMSPNELAHNVFTSSIECVICERTRNNSDLIQKGTASSTLLTLICDRSCIQQARHIANQYLLNFSYTSKASKDDIFVCLKAAVLVLRNCRSEDLDLFLEEFVFKYLKRFSSLCCSSMVLSAERDVESFGVRKKNSSIILEDEALKHVNVAVQILAEVSLRPEKPKEALIYLNANKSLRIVLDCLDTAHKKLQNPLSQNFKEAYEKLQESCCYALLKMHPINKDKVMEVLRKDENIAVLRRNAESNCFEIKKYSFLFLNQGTSITEEPTLGLDLDQEYENN